MGFFQKAFLILEFIAYYIPHQREGDKPKDTALALLSHPKTMVGDTEEKTIQKGFNKVANLIEKD